MPAGYDITMRTYTVALVALLFGCPQDYAVIEPPDQVVIVYDDTGNEPAPSPVPDTGPDTAEPAFAWSDSAYQKIAAEKLDYLVLIDRSCSMLNTTDIANVESGLYALVTSLPATGWRMALASTDPDDVAISQWSVYPGYLSAGDSATDSWLMFDELTGDREEGFSATYSYIETNPFWPVWTRSDAALAVLIVSDENERSGWNIQLFADWLLDQRDEVYFDVVIDGDAYVSRYLEAAALLNGAVLNIADGDWSQLDNIGTFRSFTHVELSRPPRADTLLVFYDGAEQQGGWTYDAAIGTHGAVVFDTAPAGGTWVTVTYVIDDD